jgi:hypothetical protein
MFIFYLKHLEINYINQFELEVEYLENLISIDYR